MLNAINSAGLLSVPELRRWSHIAGLERARLAPAYNRLIPPLDRLMLADYDASIRTCQTRK
jgi:hypothetical protein